MSEGKMTEEKITEGKLTENNLSYTDERAWGVVALHGRFQKIILDYKQRDIE